MAVINAGLAVVGYVFGPDTEGGVHLGNALFFLLLLTLLVTLFDRFRPEHLARFAGAGSARAGASGSVVPPVATADGSLRR